DTARAEGVLRHMVRTLGGSDARAMFDAVGQLLVASTINRFARGVGPDGKAWKPSRRAVEEGGQTLVDKAFLRNSITHVASAGGVDVGTNVIYAAIHQFGSGGLERPKNIPARPFLGLDDDDADAIERLVLARLASA
ncbi:MAG: phage virion morphogenesis protein, partial [Acidobacteria bacterium]|nr:phage virion morphogenesis protein [Acidobacteriota bacterium]